MTNFFDMATRLRLDSIFDIDVARDEEKSLTTTKVFEMEMTREAIVKRMYKIEHD